MITVLIFCLFCCNQFYSITTRHSHTLCPIGGIGASGESSAVDPTHPTGVTDTTDTSGLESDDEATLSSCVLPIEDETPSDFTEMAIACMPTVRRGNGTVEYVSNAVKSWRLATKDSKSIRRLVVFDMDASDGKGWESIQNAWWSSRSRHQRPKWIEAVFGNSWEGKKVVLPTWLEVTRRENNTIVEPRKITLEDSEDRVKWRSKEALDYAEVVQRCGSMTSGKYVIVVQDDVLFTSRIGEAVEWCEEHMVDRVVVDEASGRTKIRRICSVSLFDLVGAGRDDSDGHPLESSNMVARVWEREKISALHRYIVSNFDEAPVDWLVDRQCKSKRRKTIVMEPNGVRHRGVVSSFDKNKREGTLT